MDNRVLTISQHAQAIIDATADLPSKYASKIEELCGSLIAITAMASGKGVKVINVEDLATGENKIDDDLTAIVNEAGELKFTRG